MTALVKGKRPIQSPDTREPQPRINHDQDSFYPPRFTPPHVHATQREYPQREPASLEQRTVPSAHLGQDLDDPLEIVRLKIDDHDVQDKYRSLEERLKAIEGSATKDFADIVLSGELIENAIKSGIMEGSESSKKAALVKKKEAEAYMVGTENHYTSNLYPTQSRPRYRPPPNFYYPPQNPYYQAPPHYPSYPVYATNNQKPVTMFPQNTMPAQSQRILRFDGTSNTTGNLLPNHTERNVSAVAEEDKWRTKSCVSEIKRPLQKIWKSCEEFRKLLQDMMDNKEIGIFNQEADEGEVCTFDNQSSSFPYSVDQPLVIYNDAKKEQVKSKIIIKIPSPFPYKGNKTVSWKYDVNIITFEGEKSKVMTGSVGEVGHFTPSGRCYSKMVEPTKKISDSNQKGKAPMHEAEVELETPSEQEVKRPVNEKEVHEFLKFIKHSEYNIVEQLSKQPARLSILSLLLNSEPYKNALLKVLNQAHVASNISVKKLDRWVNNLNADNFISFSDDEIPPNGRGSVKALHITTRCKGYIIPNVLINKRFTLNVIPLATFSRVPIDLSYLRPCHSTVRAFDETRREVMGKIKIPLEVGPYIYDIEFQVMDITPSYNCLLRRPWIHSVGVVPSSLHQKVKFIMDSLLVTIVGEEDIVASISTDTPYIEVSKDTVECSFRSFELINSTFVAKGNKIPVPKLSRNTQMRIELTVGKGARARKGLGRYQQGIVRALKLVLIRLDMV
ncbi:uncharacterized protein LOC108455065 [Gossypium arboreum]|uniref:uncharacterized protein LOC108455065 n=1 Tax=Gossypium arboreum TaxID=29729 RepID=UPI0022F1AB46|nr:uncharacterized protein LOC108455065 [Gossypium arboreum]